MSESVLIKFIQKIKMVKGKPVKRYVKVEKALRLKSFNSAISVEPRIEIN